VQGGWSVGYGMAVLLFMLVFSIAPPELAWRFLFFIGLAPALLVLWIRRYVEEPEIYQETKLATASAGTGQKWQFTEIFGPALRRRTILATMLAMGALGGNYVTLTWLATYLTVVHNMSVVGTGTYLAINISGSFLGYLVTAHLSDWLGRRKTFVLMAFCAAVTVIIYTSLPSAGVLILLLGFPLGFFQSGIVAGIGATFAELYPTRVRAAGQGFSYNTGRAIGSFVPALVGVASTSMGMGLAEAMGIFAACSYVFVVTAALLLPETRGQELD